MKTKAQEMDVLQRAIAELGPDSYLGPWLATVVLCRVPGLSLRLGLCREPGLLSGLLPQAF